MAPSFIVAVCFSYLLEIPRGGVMCLCNLPCLGFTAYIYALASGSTGGANDNKLLSLSAEIMCEHVITLLLLRSP